MEKVVIAQLLEATKSVLDHLRQWQINSVGNSLHEAKSREVSSAYGQVRRIRDYLQRCLAMYPLPSQFDLDTDDANLLASCSVYEIGKIEAGLDAAVNASERRWGEERIKALMTSVDHLATKPIERIATMDALRLTTPRVRDLIGKIRIRTTGGAGGQSGDGTMPSRIMRGFRAEVADRAAGDILPTGAEDDAWKPIEGTPAGASAASPGPAPMAKEAAAGSVLIGAGFASMAGAAAGKKPAESSPESTRQVLIDAQRIHDPRLRAIVAMDHAAFDRAIRAQDHRMAVVHLASLVEGVFIDYALQRRQELGLKGLVENWKPEELASHILDGRINSLDKTFLINLFASRNMLRPALQLSNPIVVTQQTVMVAKDVLQRVLKELGIVQGNTPAAHS